MCRDVVISTEFDISAGPGERWIIDIEVCKIEFIISLSITLLDFPQLALCCYDMG